jgi:hypothetical protein
MSASPQAVEAIGTPGPVSGIIPGSWAFVVKRVTIQNRRTS